MLKTGPTSAKPGHTNDTGTYLRRVFAFLNPFSRRIRAVHKAEKRKARSNSEYHLTAAQLHRMIAAGRTQRDRTLIRLLAETGLRRTEACDLKVEDIRFSSCLIVVRNGKGGKSRLVPVTGTLLEDLRQIASARASTHALPSAMGQRLSERQVNRIVAHAGHRARITNPNPRQKNITCHLLRHSFARLWKQHAGSIESLSKILGHASVKTTWDLYGTEGLSDLQANYRRMMRKFAISQQNQEELNEKER